MSDPTTVQEFSARWEALTGKIFDLRDTVIPSGLKQALSELDPDGPGSILVWETPLISGWDTAEWLREWGYDPVLVRFDSERLVDEGGRPWERGRLKAAASEARVGISAGIWAVAHTGSVAFYGDRTRGLWPSLLPPVHLIVLSADTICRSLGEGLRRLAAEAGGIPPEVKLVTGPSSTGDIEGQSVIGVHGPGRVGILLVR